MEALTFSRALLRRHPCVTSSRVACSSVDVRICSRAAEARKEIVNFCSVLMNLVVVCYTRITELHAKSHDVLIQVCTLIRLLTVLLSLPPPSPPVPLLS